MGNKVSLLFLHASCSDNFCEKSASYSVSVYVILGYVPLVGVIALLASGSHILYYDNDTIFNKAFTFKLGITR